MKVIDLSSKNSLLGNFIAQIRDKKIQKDPARFRLNLERVGEIFAYEISKTLNYSVKEVTTPLGISEVSTCDDRIVAATILRAGLPLHIGITNFFTDAGSAFIAAYRKYDKGGGFQIKVEYCTCPSIEGKVLIMTDAMLATGISIEECYNRLCENGKPAATHIVCPVSCVQAIDMLKKSLPDKNITLWTAGIDEELTTKGYIIPGLGDAGDLAYGDKD